MLAPVAAGPKYGALMLAEALRYATLGKPVFPLVPGTKKPLTANGFKDATTDPARITTWWTETPNANIGIPTGAVSGLTVLDVDIKPWRGKRGDETLSALLDQFGALPATAMQNTWSGGYQYFFEAVPGLRNSSGKLGASLDIRGDGGYVVVPPSIVGEDDRSGLYLWEPYAALGETTLAPMPTWITERLSTGAPDAKQRPEVGWSDPLVDGVPEGTRDETCWRLINRYLFKGLRESEVLAFMLAWAANSLDAEGQPFPAESVREKVSRAYSARPSPPDDDEPARERPTVVQTGDHFEDLELMWDALRGANEPPTVFRFGGALYKMKSNTTMIGLDTDRLHHRLINLVNWVRMSAKGEVKPGRLERDLLRIMLNDDDVELPVLERIVKAPVFAKGGYLVQTPGYDAPSGLYLALDAGLTIDRVSDKPSDDEIERARGLLYELVIDFPFQTQADRTAILALILLPFARDLISGATPLHLIEAATPGTGKSLLLSTVSTVAIGTGIGAMTEAENEEETRKRITAQLLEEPTYVVFENLNRMMRGGALAQALTAKIWKDRILGVNKMATIPIRCCWVAVANNPSFSEEVADRVCPCRIVADVERPRDRDPRSFAHDLPGWAEENRSALIWSCLTLIQHWIAIGRPRGGAVLGSFQEWAETMSGILESAGITGLLENRGRLFERADPVGDARKAFVQSWYLRWMADPKAVFHAADLIDPASQAGLAIDASKVVAASTPDGKYTPRPAKSEETKMGIILTALVDKVYAMADGVTVTVQRLPRDDKGQVWSLVQVTRRRS